MKSRVYPRVINSLLLLLTLFLFQVGSSYCAEQIPLLKGKVTHSHQLDPMPAEYRTGVTFQDQTFRQIPGNDWFRIPGWLAGVWTNKSGIETTTYSYDLRTKRKSTVANVLRVDPVNWAWGQQTDADAQIWHYVGAPYTSEEHLPEKKQSSFSTVYQLLPVVCTNSQFVVRYRSHYVVVEDITKKVLKSFAMEEFQSMNLLNPSRLMCESDMAQYDDSGKMTYRQKVVRFLDRYSEFSPVTQSATGQDLSTMFRQYLISVGLSNLLPVDSPSK